MQLSPFQRSLSPYLKNEAALALKRLPLSAGGLRTLSLNFSQRQNSFLFKIKNQHISQIELLYITLGHVNKLFTLFQLCEKALKRKKTTHTKTTASCWQIKTDSKRYILEVFFSLKFPLEKKLFFWIFRKR